MQWRVEQIVQATGGRLLYGVPGQTYAGVGIDSRVITADRLFVAIRGSRYDGHRFVDEVVAKGVRGLVIEAALMSQLSHDAFQGLGVACVAVDDTTRALGALACYTRTQHAIPVVAITGSNGKTSTRLMTTAVMSERFNTLSTQGNLNNEIGLPLTLFQLTAEHEAVVVELGMNHPGELSRLGAICQPTIGVITNVGPAHLEYLGSLAGVARAKAELIDSIIDGYRTDGRVACGSPVAKGTVVLNADDPLVAAMAEHAGDRRVLFFGTNPNAQVRAEQIRSIDQGVAFDLVLPALRAPMRLATAGRFMVANALAAAAVGYATGLSPQEIKNGLAKFRQIKGRLQVIDAGRAVRIIDDTYNANPSSMAAAIDTWQELRGANPGIIMVGDMLELGDQAEQLHRQLGARAAAGRPKRLYACGRYAEEVAQGARAAGLADHTIFVGTLEAAVRDVLGYLEGGCWVLVKGSRGMAMERIVEAIVHWAGPTDDRK